MEVELKFSVPDRATFEKLCRLETLAGYRLTPGGVKRIYDRYLDTDDGAIMQSGYACRVRHKEPSPETLEEGIYIATLKGLGGADAISGIHRRAEYEVQIKQDDPVTWPDSPARDLVLQLRGSQPLRELFSLRQERHIRILDAIPEGTRRVAELSLDMVTFVLKGESAPHPYYELEIELWEQDHEPALQAAADVLKTVWGLRPEPRSKFERGLALTNAGARGG